MNAIVRANANPVFIGPFYDCAGPLPTGFSLPGGGVGLLFTVSGLLAFADFVGEFIEHLIGALHATKDVRSGSR